MYPKERVRVPNVHEKIKTQYMVELARSYLYFDLFL